MTRRQPIMAPRWDACERTTAPGASDTYGPRASPRRRGDPLGGSLVEPARTPSPALGQAPRPPLEGQAADCALTPSTMRECAKLCEWTLGRAHARSGSPGLILGRLGSLATRTSRIGRDTNQDAGSCIVRAWEPEAP